MSESLTYDDILAVLDARWDLIGTLDPWVNGTMDAELDGVTDVAERSVIVDRYQKDHDWCVGQRMAIDGLRYTFRETTGTPDPVQEMFRQSWDRLNAYFEDGGSVDDLTFGPIEVIPKLEWRR